MELTAGYLVLALRYIRHAKIKPKWDRLSKALKPMRFIPADIRLKLHPLTQPELQKRPYFIPMEPLNNYT